MFTIAAVIGLFFFYQSYHIFNKVQGFIKRLIISTCQVSGSLAIAAISPENNNASSGALLFLLVPSLFISSYLLYKSRPALKVKVLYKRAYNKPLKQDK
jgi:putative effector of murein hydrolase